MANPIRYEINGSIYEFDSEPTEQDIEEIARQSTSVEQRPVGRNIKDIPESEFTPKNPYIEATKKTASDIGKSFVNMARGIVEPIDRAVVAYPQQVTKALITGKKEPVETLFAGKVDWPESMGQVAGDVAASSFYVPGLASGVGTAIKTHITPIKWVKNIWGSKKAVLAQADKIKKVIMEEASDKIASLKNEAVKKKVIVSRLNKKYADVVSREEDALKIALNKAEEKYSGKVSSESFKTSSAIRKDLPNLYKQESQKYGEGLNALLSKTNIQASKSEVLPTLEESLMNHGILNIDDAGKVVIQRTGATKAESQILKEYIRLRNLPDDATINIGELVQSQSLVRPKYGKVWNSSDHLQSEVTEGLSSIISQKSPEVAAYRKAYAPFLEWKKAANKEFRPFNGKYSNKGGANILSKYADVNKRLTSDESKLISELEDYAGKEYTANLKSLRGHGREILSRKQGIQSISKARGEEIRQIAEQRKAIIENEIQSKIDDIRFTENMSINDLNSKTQAIINDIKTRRYVIGGVAALSSGGAIFKFIKHRLAYNLFGITGE